MQARTKTVDDDTTVQFNGSNTTDNTGNRHKLEPEMG